MGNLDSCFTPRPHPETIIEKLEITYKEDLNDISDCLATHFYILDLNSNQNRALVAEILNERQQVRLFTTIHELKEFKDDQKNNVLIVCDENHQFFETMLPNSKAFQRIGFAHYQPIQNIQNARQVLKKMHGYRFSGLVAFQKQPILTFLRTPIIPRNIYFCDYDFGFINRALANIHFFLDREVEHPFSMFHYYLQAQGPEARVLDQDLSKVINQKGKVAEFIASKVAEGNPTLIRAIDLLKSTSNPGIIAHVSWFYDMLHAFIKKSYAALLPTLKTTEIFIVVDLTPEEASYITQNGNFMFSTFVVGYTSLAEAQEVKDQSRNSFIFIVNLPRSDLNRNLPRQDFGFCLLENRVIFTVQTFFTIDRFNREQREILATYGVLGKQLSFRRQEFRYLNVAKLPNVNMLKYVDYLTYSKFYIKSQSDLLLHLQFYHRYKSLPKSGVSTANSLINQPESTVVHSPPLAASGGSSRSEFWPTVISDEKAADVEAALGNVQVAEEYYKSVVPVDRGMIKKLYMFDSYHRDHQFSETIQQLRDIQITEVFDNRFLQITLMSYNSVMLAERGQNRQAEKKIEESIRRLIEEFKAKFVKRYNLHDVSISSFPLYSIVLRNSAKAARKLGNGNEAEMHEGDYELCWPFFDGTHISWLP